MIDIMHLTCISIPFISLLQQIIIINMVGTYIALGVLIEHAQQS